MDIKNAIIYIGISISMSSVIYAIYQNNSKAAIILAVLFFVVAFMFIAKEYYLYCNNIKFYFKKMSYKILFKWLIFVVLFFVIGTFNNIMYYQIKSFDNSTYSVRITKQINKSYIGEYKGRNVFICGNMSDYNASERVYIYGSFKKEIDTGYGNVGTIEVNKAYKINDDFFTMMSKFRKYIFDKIEQNIGRRRAALVSSLAFGYSDYLDNDDKEEMQNLGVIHAISVSGLHIALVYGILSKVLGKKISLIVTFFYTIFTGAAFSSIRAFIMISLNVLGVDFRRKYNPLSALAFSSVLINIYKPYSIFNLGFWLSFSAVLGMILFYRKIELSLYRLPKYLRETIAVSISASVFTTPILIYSFEKISYLSIIGNIIVVPILTLIIEIGNMMIGFVNIKVVFDFICYIITKIIDVLDIILSFTEDYNKSLMINKEFFIVYCFMLITIYFYKKGFKKVKILFYSTVLSSFIFVYSPFISVKYIDNQVFLVSYRGERKLFCNLSNYKVKESKAKNMAKEVYREASNINIKNVHIKACGKNYIMYINNRKYIILLSSKKDNNDNNIESYYDIIDFINNKHCGFFIIGDKIITY